jgi:hypothetical protein
MRTPPMYRNDTFTVSDLFVARENLVAYSIVALGVFPLTNTFKPVSLSVVIRDISARVRREE